MSLNISLEPQEVQVVLAGLGEIQLKNSLDIWLKVRSQAESQMAAQQPSAATGDGGKADETAAE